MGTIELAKRLRLIYFGTIIITLIMVVTLCR